MKVNLQKMSGEGNHTFKLFFLDFFLHSLIVLHELIDEYVHLEIY